MSAARVGEQLVVRPVQAVDRAAWLLMRGALWPDSDAVEHQQEVAGYFAGRGGPGMACVLVASRGEQLVGFCELSIRTFVDGCRGDRVGYLEGWFVAPEARRRGVGRKLVDAALSWAREQRCTEFASDTELDNGDSAAAHRALGFAQVAVVRLFRREL